MRPLSSWHHFGFGSGLAYERAACAHQRHDWAPSPTRSDPTQLDRRASQERSTLDLFVHVSGNDLDRSALGSSQVAHGACKDRSMKVLRGHDEWA